MGGRLASRIEQRPAWEILLEGARRLMDNGTTAFTRAQLIAHVQHKDPSRDRPSIDPIIQGMTENATGGPPSACGIVFRRVEVVLRANVSADGNVLEHGK